MLKVHTNYGLGSGLVLSLLEMWRDQSYAVREIGLLSRTNTEA